MILCVSVSGCENKEKVDSNKEFSADDISKIVMDISSWNIEVLASRDDRIKVDYKGKAENSSDVQITQEDNTLMIQQDDGQEKNIAQQFSFGEAGKITLYVPKNAKILWEMDNGSGDVELETAVSSDFSLNNDSGYITMSGLTAESAKINSQSGDIKITDSSLADFDIHVKSAYVTLKNIDIDNANILTGSGEVNINSINAYRSLSVETGSGDISLSHGTMPDNLYYNISSGSDDVTVQFQNAEYTANIDGCKQGNVGNGQNNLSIMSDSGTVIVK